MCIFSYCAKIYLKSPPDMWLCEVCRSSARVLHIPSLVDKDVEDLTTDHGASSSEISSDRSKKHKPPYLAFPSPKRKPRTPRVPGKICFNFSFCRKMRLCFCVSNCVWVFFFLVDPEEAHDPCVFRRIDWHTANWVHLRFLWAQVTYTGYVRLDFIVMGRPLIDIISLLLCVMLMTSFEFVV